MNKQRPKVYETEEHIYTNIPQYEQEAKPNNIMKKDNRNNQNTIKDFKVNIDDNDELLLWVNLHIKKNPDYLFKGVFKIIKIDTERNRVKLEVESTGEIVFQPLGGFIETLRAELKKDQLKIEGKPIEYKQILAQIEKDIELGRQFNGKTMKYIDYETELIHFEDGTTKDLTMFAAEYAKKRKLGFAVGEDIKQALSNEQERQRNIDDMALALQKALGIQPPKIQYVKPNKETRNIGLLRNNLYNVRDPSFIWTTKELENVYKTGNIPNSKVQVSGQLNNTFIPELLPPKFAREGAGLNKMRWEGEVNKKIQGEVIYEPKN